MGKTLIYFLLALILGVGVYFFVLRNNEDLYQEAEANFTIRDTASVGKIFLVQNNGESILLERGAENVWMVNKKYPAMPVQILNILTCMKMQTAHAPVGEKEHDRVIKLLAGLSTKVEVYNREGQKIRSFYVAGQGANYHGSYMILEHAQQPYLVEIVGFQGYLTPRYTTDLNDWRSREVFHVLADSIKSISVQYPSEMLNSFTINNSGASPQLEYDPQLKAIFTQMNMTRVKSYLDFFKEINAESFLNGVEGMDSTIRKSKLRCTMTLTKKSGVTTTLDIYWIDINKYRKDLSDQTTSDSTKRPMNVDRLYAVNQTSHDTILIQARTFEPLFRRSYEFYQAEDAEAPQQKPQARPAPRPPYKN